MNRRSLSDQIQEIEWHWLKPHLERDAVIVVAPALDLGEVASHVASDDTVAVGGWIESGRIVKPNREQIRDWNARPDGKFLMVIVQPYVLIQQKQTNPGKE